MSKGTTRFNAPRLREATVSELYGLCMGVLADGFVAEQEVEFLLEWVHARPHLLEDPVAADLVETLQRAMEKGVEQPDMQPVVLDAMLGFTGAPLPSAPQSAQPSSIPLCSPVPEVNIVGSVICCTGTFDLGTRSECQRWVEAAGGTFSKGVTKKVSYLVIGNQVTPDWKQQTYGAKIMKAMEYRDNGNIRISIIDENTFVNAISDLVE